MAQLTRRLVRLERMAGGLLPDPSRCPCCHGRPRLAFADEPGNTLTPYDPHQRCPLCRTVPAGTEVLPLPDDVAELFAGVPWSQNARQRFIEKTVLLTALAEGKLGDAEHLVRRLQERASSSGGERHG